MTIRDLAKLYCDSHNVCSDCDYGNCDSLCAIRLLSNFDRRIFDFESNTMLEAIKSLADFEQTLGPSYLDDFLSRYPNAPMSVEGLPLTCPDALYKNAPNQCQTNCRKCWTQKM